MAEVSRSQLQGIAQVVLVRSVDGFNHRENSAMILTNEPIPVAIVIVAGSSASSALAMADLLGQVGRPWQLSPSALQDNGAGAFAPYRIAEPATPVSAPPGLRVVRLGADHEREQAAAVFIPEIKLLPEPDQAASGWSAWRSWLRECHEQGAIVSSAGTGVALLADAGLLDEQPACTHWAFVQALQAQFPLVKFDAAEAFSITDTPVRIMTAGGGQAWTDLALQLIATLAGRDAALQMARLNMIQWHEFGQRPYREPLTNAAMKDAPIGRAVQWLNEHYTRAAPISSAVEEAGLPERTFTRRFHLATGASPLEYVHQLRLNRARRLLESTDLSVQVVARELGYEDPSFFSRLFKREVSLTPAQYRKRFAPLFRALPEEPGRSAAAIPVGSGVG